MSELASPTVPSAERPVVSDVSITPSGRTFRITFMAGQLLPAHASASRITIAVVRGFGTIAFASDPYRRLAVGDFVQIEAKETHDIAAGDDGLELIVSSIENCCQLC